MSDEVTEKVRPRRRRLLVPLVGVGIAAWALRRRFSERTDLTEGWHRLPPVPRPADVPAERSPRPAPAEPSPVAQPVEVRARAVPAAAAVATIAAPARSAPAAPAEPAAQPDEPHGPGSVRALADGSSPDPGYTVKGKTASRTFHVPGGAYFTRTRADVWFRTADDARRAGFTERTRTPR